MKKDLLKHNDYSDAVNLIFAGSFYASLTSVLVCYESFIMKCNNIVTIADQTFLKRIIKLTEVFRISLKLSVPVNSDSRVQFSVININRILNVYCELNELMSYVIANDIELFDNFLLFFNAYNDLFECYLRNSNLISRQ
jgi:hypothetical protein